MPFANTGIKHSTIAMANVGARAVYTRIRMLRVHVLSIRTSTDGQGLAALMKDIPISTTGLFGCDLRKVVVKAVSASRNYNSLADRIILSGFPRPPRGGKRKASSSPPFRGKGQSRNWQSHSLSSTRSRTRRRLLKGKGAGHQTGKAKQQQPKSGSKGQAKPCYRKGKGSHT